MALNNVPISGQSLNASRPLINANFMTIDTVFSVNHVDYNDPSGDQGKHKFVTMPRQGSDPTTVGTDVALFSKLSGFTAESELFWRKEGNGAVVSMTESLQANNGWTKLPSGILIKWQSGLSFMGSTLRTINLNTTAPNFTNVFAVYISTTDTAGTYNNVIGLESAPGISIDVRAFAMTPVPGTVSFSYLAIGI